MLFQDNENEEKELTIFDILKKGDVTILNDYLSCASLADVNMRNAEGYSVLHLACKVLKREREREKFMILMIFFLPSRL
jgi:hypothetical protein